MSHPNPTPTPAPVRVILASQSPRRRELLAQIGITHEVRPVSYTHLTLPTNREV